MFDIPLSFFEKNKRTSTKKCIGTLIGVRIRLGFFWSIDPPPECSRSIHFSWKVFWNTVHKSVDCIHHSIVRTELTTSQSFLESRNSQKSQGVNQDYKGGGRCRITSLCLLASQASMTLVVWGRVLSWCKIHRCFNSNLFIRICRCYCCNTLQ